MKSQNLKWLRRSRQLPVRLQDGVVQTHVGSRHKLMGANDYRCHIYFPVLDNFLAEMNRRFSTTIMKATQTCTLGSRTFFNLEVIEEFCLFLCHYLAIKSEIEVTKRYLSTQDIEESSLALLDALSPNFNANAC